MTDFLIKDTTLTDIAGSLRTRLETAVQYTPEEMVAALKGFAAMTTFRLLVERSGDVIIDTPGDVLEIRNNAMRQHSSLTSVSFPQAEIIDASAFQYCNNLVFVDIPSAKEIGAEAFVGCTSLTHLYLPNATSIGRNTFNDCTSLVALVLGAPEVCDAQIPIANSSSPIYGGEGYIYVPDELVRDYKNSSRWAYLADHIKPISELE